MGINPVILTDEQLFEQIRASDKLGLQELHDRYRNLVYTVAFRVCGQSCDAEAVLVTVFWEIWKNPTRWNPQRGPARTYLLLLTRSRARDLMRSEVSRATRNEKREKNAPAIVVRLNPSLTRPSSMQIRARQNVFVRKLRC